MVRFVGLDVHKRSLVYCILAADGEILAESKLNAVDAKSLAQLAQQLTPDDQVALEATTNCWAVARALRPHAAQVTVSNPLTTKAIAQAKVKTDKVDARVLAQLLRCGYLPEVWQPTPDDERLREWTARRSRLVSHKTAIANRLHATLAQRLIVCPVELLSAKGRAWLCTVPVDEDARWLLDSDLRLLSAVENELAAIDTQLAQRGCDDVRVKLLMTLPGVSQHTAQSLLAAVGDVSRFRQARALGSYLGLVPSTRQSGDRCYHGRITKAGRGHTRWMLVQAAHAVRNHPGPLGHFYRRLKRKKSHNVAVVAVAHKLATLAWHVLTTGTPYRYALPRTTEEKLRKLRTRGGGVKRRTGPPKGKKCVAKLAGGSRTEKPLAEVFASEGLPALAAAPAGERQHLERLKLQDFAAALAQEQVRPRRRGDQEKNTPLAG